MKLRAMLFVLLATSLSGCAGTGDWTPIHPANYTREQAEMDMEYCAQYGDFKARGSLAVVAVAVRNSYVESCMRNRGYRKVSEVEATTAQTPMVDAEAKK